VIGLSVICSAPWLAACGSSSGPGGGGGSANFRATIDGVSWAADANGAEVVADAKAPGVIGITGTHAASASNYLSLELDLGYLIGPKTYPLGVNAGTTAGGGGTVLQVQGTTTAIWTTDFSGNRGSITVTSLSGGRFAGTFLFTAPPEPGFGATGDRTVTDGSFDLPLPAEFQAAAADDYGSSISATLNGQAWNGATVTGLGNTSTGALAFGGTSTDYLVNFGTTMPVQAGQTYDQTAMQLTASSQSTSSPLLWGAAGTVCSVTVTSLTAKRVAGTFTATLPGVGTNTTPLVITNGVFDVRIDPAN
jgi:hypothetical protein